MKNNTNKINLFITILGIAILAVATVGATLAYFSSISNTTEQDIKTGKINIKATSSKLNASDIKPTTWDPLISTNVANPDIAQIKFSVNTYGTSIEDAKYNIYFTTSGIKLNEEKNLKGGLLSDIKWKLIDTQNNIIGSGDFSNGDYTSPLQANTNPIIINDNATDEDSATQTYILFIYIEDNGKQDQLQNLSISATMSAKAIQ